MLVFDIFAGMGALEFVLTRCLDPAWLEGTHVVAFEIDAAARAVLAQKHSGLNVTVSDTADLDGQVGSGFALLEGNPPLLESFLEESVDAVLVCGGSPCVGFSRANPGGRGIEDSESRKLWLLPVVLARIRQALERQARRIPVLFLVENVVMSEVERDAISLALGVPAVELEAGELAAADRPRLAWTTMKKHVERPRWQKLRLVGILLLAGCQDAIYPWIFPLQHRQL